MPSFRIRNLNISLPDEYGLRDDLVRFCTLGATGIWPYGCCVVFTIPCRLTTKPDPPPTCRLFTIPDAPTCGTRRSWVVAQDPTEELVQLEQLKSELEQAMKAVEARGVELQRQVKPQTREEVEMLEKQLTEALEELQAMKGDLE